MPGMDMSLLDGAALAPGEAIKFLRQKALVPSEAFGEIMGAAHARGFTVAGATSEAMLSELKEAVQSALRDGTGFAEFRKKFDSITKRHKWDFNGEPGWRASIIYSTNLTTAYSAGQYAQLDTEEAREIFPYWRYCHHACPHPRVEHMLWDGLVLRNDDPWWETHYPPNGWRCHCTVEPVTRSAMKRNKWEVSEAPPLRLTPWKNPATGKTEMIPHGIDPSFNYNPGKSWLDHQAGLAKKQAPLAPENLAHLPGPERRQKQGEAVKRLLKPGATGSVNAGTIPRPVQEALESKNDTVILSKETLQKNEKHRELTEADYVALPDLLEKPVLVVKQDRQNAGFILKRGEKLYRLILKRTQAGDENFISSFSVINIRGVNKTLRKYGGSVIIDNRNSEDNGE